jgi:hypothetical protein
VVSRIHLLYISLNIYNILPTEGHYVTLSACLLFHTNVSGALKLFFFYIFGTVRNNYICVCVCVCIYIYIYISSPSTPMEAQGGRLYSSYSFMTSALDGGE